MQDTGVENLRFNLRSVGAMIQRSFPGHKFHSIEQGCKGRQEQWQKFSHPSTNPGDLKALAKQGFTKVQLLIVDPVTMRRSRPDYFIWELGEPFKWEVGDKLEVDVNQGMRPAVILATHGKDEALLEYKMPNGTSALWVIRRGSERVVHLRNQSYKSCPKKWLAAIEESGMQWAGNGQKA